MCSLGTQKKTGVPTTVCLTKDQLVEGGEMPISMIQLEVPGLKYAFE